MLFTFPSQYYALSVFRSYSALRDGPRGFRQDSSCPALLRVTPAAAELAGTGLSPCIADLSRPFPFAPSPRLAALQPRTRLDGPGLGSFLFARHYSGNRCFFLFLQVLRCFSSLRSLLLRCRTFSAAGSPIRNPADHIPFADPRGFSQLATSFFAGGSLGIPRTPLLYCPVNLVAASPPGSAA